MHTDDTYRRDKLSYQPDGAFDPAAGRYQKSEGEQHTEGDETEYGIWDAHQAGLFGLHDRAATENRIDVTGGLIAGVGQDLDLIVGQDERCHDADSRGQHQNVWQDFLKSELLEKGHVLFLLIELSCQYKH